jgi:hypothetical protein
MKAADLVFLWLLCGLCGAGLIPSGCRRPSRGDLSAGAGRAGVGWTVEGDGLVQSGTVTTQPPGHEEKVFPLIAGQAAAWASGCAPLATAGEGSDRQGSGGQPPRATDARAIFAFVVEADADGSLRAGPSGDQRPLARCLAAKAVAGLAGQRFPRSIRVSVKLALRIP